MINDFLFPPLLIADVFLLVAGGVCAGLFILIIEIIFKRHRERLEKDQQISRTAAIHWKQRIEVRMTFDFSGN